MSLMSIRSLLCLSSACDLPLLVQVVPSGRHDLLLKVIGDQNKAFVSAGTGAVSGAQRLIQAAAGVASVSSSSIFSSEKGSSGSLGIDRQKVRHVPIHIYTILSYRVSLTCFE